MKPLNHIEHIEKWTHAFLNYANKYHN